LRTRSRLPIGGVDVDQQDLTARGGDLGGKVEVGVPGSCKLVCNKPCPGFSRDTDSVKE
jgi:hypothetical protein